MAVRAVLLPILSLEPPVVAMMPGALADGGASAAVVAIPFAAVVGGVVVVAASGPAPPAIVVAGMVVADVKALEHSHMNSSSAPATCSHGKTAKMSSGMQVSVLVATHAREQAWF